MVRWLSGALDLPPPHVPPLCPFITPLSSQNHTRNNTQNTNYHHGHFTLVCRQTWWTRMVQVWSRYGREAWSVAETGILVKGTPKGPVGSYGCGGVPWCSTERAPTKFDAHCCADNCIVADLSQSFSTPLCPAVQVITKGEDHAEKFRQVLRVQEAVEEGFELYHVALVRLKLLRHPPHKVPAGQASLTR